ncbi:MAG TPA: hypothetical protein ENI23_14835 [bacterium]|nr:hypothetical protein [bacterium]
MTNKEKFRIFLRTYIEKHFDDTVETVMKAVKTRENFYIHVSLQVYITKESQSPESLTNFTGQVIIRDLREKRQKLDERHN